MLLEIDDIHTYYGNSYVLQGLSLHVGSGEVKAVLGRNGAGKTTLIRSIIGFTPPRRGRITFNGRDLKGLSSHQIARLGVGLVPQGHRLFPSLTVLENLTVVERPKGPGGWTLDRIFALFPRLQERVSQLAGSLSGGEQQMLSISRALMGNPDVLLLDEPTEGLAPELVRIIRSVLLSLKEGGASILLVEQHLSFALKLADYVYVVNQGKIVHESSGEEFKKNRSIQQLYLGL